MVLERGIGCTNPRGWVERIRLGEGKLVESEEQEKEKKRNEGKDEESAW